MTLRIALASAMASFLCRCKTWYVSRSADFFPMPGSLANWLTSSVTAWVISDMAVGWAPPTKKDIPGKKKSGGHSPPYDWSPSLPSSFSMASFNAGMFSSPVTDCIASAWSSRALAIA